jgi:hypothetical protein
VVEAHLGARDGEWLVLSRLAAPWTQDHTVLDRFGPLAKVLEKPTSPHVAPLVEFGAGGDGHWFVHATGDGEPLRAMMTSKAGRLSLDEALSVVEQVASGLTDLHRAGLVHGDVSASSVFVTNSGRALLLHAGLAAVAGSHPSRGPARSEPHALAPEQLGGLPSQATDVFRLGLLLLELVTGRSFFVAPNPMDTVALAGRYQAPPQGAFQGLPPALAGLLGEMLSAAPASRPAMSELHDAMQMASAAAGIPTGQGEVTRAFRRLLADRQPPMAARTTELRITPPRPSTPPPPVTKPAAATPISAGAAIIGRIEPRRVTHGEMEAVRPSPPASTSAPPGREAQVGEHLVRAGRLSMGQLVEAQKRAAMLNLSLEDSLIVDGVLSEDQVVEALGVVTHTAVMTSQQLGQLDGSRLPLHLLRSEDAERLVAVPLAERGPVVMVAVVDPLDQVALEELKGLIGRSLQPVRTGDRALRETITRLYGGVSDADLDSWIERGPNAGHQSDSGIVAAPATQVEVASDSGVLELEGRADRRPRSVTASGLDEGQAKLVELLFAGYGERGRDGVALMQLAGELARRMNASTQDVDKARFVVAAVAVANLRGQRPAWVAPPAPTLDAELGPLSLPVRALVPGLFDAAKGIPDDLVCLAVLCAFVFAQAGGSTCPTPWQPVITALRARRLPVLAIDALVRVLES